MGRWPEGPEGAPASQYPPKDEVHVLTSTRILARRRLGTTSAPHVTAPPRRRRRTRGFVQVASAAATERLRLNRFGHAYVGVGAVVIALFFYLALAAQITQSSYDISRLQDQQRQLIAEQDQLRYQEVTLHAPAQVQRQASQSGMQRAAPTAYVAAQPAAIDLQAPAGAAPTDATPLWERYLAALFNKVSGTRDVMAAGR